MKKRQARELLNEDFSLPTVEKYVRIEGDNPHAFTMPRLMPPIIFDLREARLSGESVVFDNPTGHEHSRFSPVDYLLRTPVMPAICLDPYFWFSGLKSRYRALVGTSLSLLCPPYAINDFF